MLLDLIDLSKLRKAILYLLYLLGVLLVQTEILSKITVLGVRAMVVPAAVAAAALFENGRGGALFGLAAGYFTDLVFPETTVWFTILFTLCGYGIGLGGKYVLRKGFVTYMVLAVLMLLLGTLGQMFPFLFGGGAAAAAALRTGLLQTLWSLPVTPLFYFPCRAIASSRKDFPAHETH